MKRHMLIMATVMVLSMPVVAMAQNAPSGGNVPSGHPGMQGPNGAGSYQGGAERREERFEEHKREMLQRINEHMFEIQKRKACVEAAKDHEQLRACMPAGHGEHGGWERQEGGHGGPEGGPQGRPEGGPQGGPPTEER